MIHIAPCSCELHVRIRELEAEMACAYQQLDEEREGRAEEEARAEKAEGQAALELRMKDAAVREWKEAARQRDEYKADMLRLDARVAELMELHDKRGFKYRLVEDPAPTRRKFVNRHDGTGEHLEDIEAREWEAD